MSSNKRPTNFYKGKWYSKNKKKSTKSNDQENDESERRKYRSLDPDQMCELLNERDTNVDFNIPYYGWKLFFSGEDYKDDSETVKKIRTIENFIGRHARSFSPYSLENLENGVAFVVDMNHLRDDNQFLNEWPDFVRHISEDSSHTLNCFKLAIHQSD